MKHSRKEQLRRARAFKAFERANPPQMPKDFSHRDYQRVVLYARCAFITGWNSGQKDMHRHWKGKP